MPNFGSESDLAVNVKGGWGIESSPLSAAQEAALDLRLAPASLCRPSQRGGISVLKCAKNLQCAQGCVPQGSGTQVRAAAAATASLAPRGHQPVLLLSNWALVSEPHSACSSQPDFPSGSLRQSPTRVSQRRSAPTEDTAIRSFPGARESLIFKPPRQRLLQLQAGGQNQVAAKATLSFQAVRGPSRRR